MQSLPIKLNVRILSVKLYVDLVDDNLLNEIANKQSEASNVLQQLDDEREALSIRMEQLIKDKKAMDAELKQLDELLQQQ